MAIYVVSRTSTPEVEAIVIYDAPGSATPFSLGTKDRGTVYEETGWASDSGDVATMKANWAAGKLPSGTSYGNVAVPVRFSYTELASGWIQWTGSIRVLS